MNFIAVNIVILLLSLTTVTGNQNLYVQHTATKFTIESRWLISSQIDVEPYHRQVESIIKHITELNEFVQHCTSQAPGAKQEDLLSSLKYSKLQISFANDKIKNIQQKLGLLTSMIDRHSDTRTKRSLLPFLGNILGSITGVATEADVRKINDHLKYLETQDRSLTHIVQDSITVVNATRFKMHTVIDHVNTLIEAMEMLHTFVMNTTSNTYNRLDNVEYSVNCYNHLNSILTILLHNVNTLDHDIEKFEIVITDIMEHRVTMHVVSPARLKRLIYSMSKSISKDLALPYNFESNLLDYYRTLSCELTHGDHGPMIIIGVPLRSSHSRYDIFHVLSIPVPYRNTSVLSIDVKHPYLALSYDKTKVVYMQEHEYILCSKPNDVICHITSPIRFTSQVQNDCSVSLLTTNSIQKCPVKLSPPSLILPQVRMLHNGIWIVITNASQHFTIICPQVTPYTVNILPPVAQLNVPLGCKAQSQHVAIPPTYVTNTLIKILPVQEFINYSISTYDKIVGHKVSNFVSKFPEQLTPILDETVDITTLNKRIDAHLAQSFQEQPFGSYYYYLWTPVIIVVIVLLAIFIYLLIKHKSKMLPCACSKETALNGTPEIDKQFEMLPQGSSTVFGESHLSLP